MPVAGRRFDSLPVGVSSTQSTSMSRKCDSPVIDGKQPQKSGSHRTCMGLSPVKGLFALAGQLICDCCLGFADSSLFGAGKAVLRPVACDQVPGRGSQVRIGLSAGGRWIRTSGSAPAATPLSDRGVKPQATAAGCHFGEILPQGATLMTLAGHGSPLTPRPRACLRLPLGLLTVIKGVCVSMLLSRIDPWPL
jgi:hypothetical protein